MNKSKLISYIQIILIITIVVLILVKPNNEIKEYDEVYIYKLSNHTFTTSVITSYEEYKNLIKDNNLKNKLNKNFFTNNYLYIYVDNEGICENDDESEITTEICYDSNEFKSYKYISCYENCKKNDIIYMLNVSKNISLEAGDLNYNILKKYRSCN